MPTPSCGPETASDARQRALLSYGTTKAGNIEIYTMFRDHPCQTSRVPGISLVQNSMTMWAILATKKRPFGGQGLWKDQRRLPSLIWAEKRIQNGATRRDHQRTRLPTTPFSYPSLTMSSPTASTTPKFSNHDELPIAIIGGGLGGLALALGLVKHGVKIQIFESAPAFAEIGADFSTDT
ncbi:predicted protein [Plenodomus lingam JN3]|uniref:Predicted protein n=1 Tax=Leptosphaeria maculans (strain JN3 / isolate v23.1.3 / race Av1-4-5-6-7-8) TaxID=985895 RepID=E5A7W8_LEPMJ|nr:predicted protein [Plenodomus lingam JN3]CBX99713.1 predicted protein [Plenodomus lingam JN3]